MDASEPTTVSLSPVPSGTSGDPLLKRLVDLAKIGWEADLVLLSNGTIVRGHLISGVKYRAALARVIARGPDTLDAIVAAAVAAEDPPAEPEDSEAPEPRFIHLANVQIGTEAVSVPFLRLRLPAVSGFWITRGDLGESVEER